MKNMWVKAVTLGVAVAVPLLTGCEWTSGGGDASSGNWNGRFNIFDFGGIYRGANGGLLVTDYTSDPGSIGTTNTVQETVGSGNGTQTVFAGILSHGSIIPGQVSFSAAAVIYRDNGAGLLIPNVAIAKTGSVSYATGQFALDFGGMAPAAAVPIVATYEFSVSGIPSTGTPAGSTQIKIYMFQVMHQGEHIRLTDNTGAIYDGRIITIKSSGGKNSEVPGEATFSNNEQIAATFEVSGTSAAGMQVKIAGIFMGTVRVVSSGGTGTSTGTGTSATTASTSTTLENRELQGTWIEAKGKTGNVHGYATASVAVPDQPVNTNAVAAVIQ